jgi:hypothetical protein
MKPPFTLSTEAADYLSGVLGNPPPGEWEPALVWCSQYSINDQELGEAFTLGFHPQGKHDPKSFFQLCGHQVSIQPTSLAKLKGKKLVLELKEVEVDETSQMIRILRVV